MSEESGRDVRHSAWDKFWKNPQGHVVIWQMPNIPLIGWAVLTVLSLLTKGRLSDVLSWLSSASLIVWALLEVSKGVNYFRRLLGLLVLVAAVMSLAKNL
jgi:hypothetical protein